MARLVDRLEPELRANRGTLVFTNTRGLAERLVWALRRRFPAWADEVAGHHSALAAKRRRAVEEGLKAGRLRAVVTSTSLELGIDVGGVDGVVLVHPPGGVVRLLQRVGRSGHSPGGARRGLILTASPAELLEAAVTAASGRVPQCEPLRVPARPLDVLCQHLLGMAAAGPCRPDEAFALARRAYPFRDLDRADFDACLDYLSGRRRDGSAWLPARVVWEGGAFRVADERTARVVRRNLGTILGDEPRPVRLREGAAVGAVEEAFADRLKPGDRFLLDGRCLEYRGDDGPALLVDEVIGRPAVPRWAGEGWPLSAALAGRLYLLRVQAAEALRDGPAALGELLRRDYGLDGPAAEALARYFERQECVSEVPEGGAVLVEVVPGEFGGDYYLHTPLSRPGNDALARVAVRRLARRRGRAVTSVVADLGLLLSVGGPEVDADEWRAAFDPAGFDAELEAALADCPSLRERFRRVALVALMLLKNPLGARRRVGGGDWAERRLFEQVRAAEPDFVLLRQARREVREELCDAAAARGWLADLPRRPWRFRRLASPSPFAEGWTQADLGAVETFDSPAEALRRLHTELTVTPS